MSDNLQVIVNEDHIRVNVTGLYDHRGAKLGLYEVLEKGMDKLIPNILIDYSKRESQPNLIQRIDYILYLSNTLQDLYKDRTANLKIAFLGPQSETQADPKVVDIVKRSGIVMKAFNTELGALQWLRSE